MSEATVGPVRLAPGERLLLVTEDILSEAQVNQLKEQFSERGFEDGSVTVVSGFQGFVVPNRERRGEEVAARVLERLHGRLRPMWGESFPGKREVYNAVGEIVADEVETTGDLRASLAALCDLILDDMPAAGNRDMAADGPVGREEEVVWSKIAQTAEEARELLP